MDPSQMDPAQLQKMQELQGYVQQQQQEMQIRQFIANVADTCFKLCVQGKPGTKMAGSERECMSNCTRRYLDVNKFIQVKLQHSNPNQRDQYE